MGVWCRANSVECSNASSVMAAALDHLSDRLRVGAKSDLLELAQITFIKSRTA